MSAKASTTVPRRAEADYRRYQQLKDKWVEEHPLADPRTYEAAMRAIARECGV